MATTNPLYAGDAQFGPGGGLGENRLFEEPGGPGGPSSSPSGGAAAGALSLADIDLAKARKHAVAAARDVGRTVLEKHGTLRELASSGVGGGGGGGDGKGVEFKGNSSDIVTDCDKFVEERLTALLCAKGTPYADFRVLGEEEFAGNAKNVKGGDYGLTDAPTWVIDPIDGTTNFVYGFPLVAISIALVVGRKPVVAVVFNPIMHELFEASLGGGALLNGNPLPLRGPRAGEPRRLAEAVVSTNVGYDRSEDGCAFTSANLLSLLQGQVRSIRMGGSAATDICWVAAGRSDAFYEWGIHPWDIAAATLVLSEVGGHVCDPHGGELDLTARCVLAAGNEDVAAAITAELQKTPVPNDWAHRQS